MILRFVLVKLPVIALNVVSLTLQLWSESIKKPAKSKVDTLKLDDVEVCRVGGLLTPLIRIYNVELLAIVLVILMVT